MLVMISHNPIDLTNEKEFNIIDNSFHRGPCWRCGKKCFDRRGRGAFCRNKMCQNMAGICWFANDKNWYFNKTLFTLVSSNNCFFRAQINDHEKSLFLAEIVLVGNKPIK